METQSFAEIQQDFIERVHRIVWCNVATIDTHNRPRSRILHPIWEGPTSWIATRRLTLKAKHLAHNPHVSLTYIADVAKPVYIDCAAEWIDDLQQKERIWQKFKDAPPPLGYDHAPIFERPDHPNFGLLKLTPWRIELINFPSESMVWRPNKIEQFTR
jgi:general stress protein 26